MSTGSATKKLRRWLCASLLAGAIPLYAEAPPDDQALQTAVAQLGDARYSVREKATKLLWGAGKTAEPLLIDASSSPNPEIASRARQILTDFRMGIYPDTPVDVADMIRTYRGGSPEEKKQAVEKLMAMGRKGWAPLAKLAATEADPAVRDEVFARASQQVGEALSEALATDDQAVAAELMELLVADPGPAGERAYAAYYLSRGNLKEKTAELEARAKAGAPNYPLLAMMHRAAGDLASARIAAERGNDPDLVDSILFEQADWTTLARRHTPETVNEEDLEQVGFAASYQRLAGNAAAADKLLKLAVKLGANGDQAQVAHAAATLLLNDRPDDAIAMFRDNRHMSAAFELLVARQRFGEAIELANTAGNVADADQVRVSLARTLNMLGRQDEARKVIDDLANVGLAAQDGGITSMAIALEQEAGRNDAADRRAGEALAGGDEKATVYLEALYPDRGMTAEVWWKFLRGRDPAAKPAATLASLRMIMEAKTPPAELEKLAMAAANTLGNSPLPGLRALAESLYRAGRMDAARALLTRAITAGDEVDDYIQLADINLSMGQWKLAADQYEAAWQKDKNNPVPLYLRGHCLSQLGQKEAGAKLMAQATVMPLADAPRRRLLALALDAAGLHAAAIEQHRIIFQTAGFDSWELNASMRHMWLRARQTGDYARSADLIERCALDCLHMNTHFTDQSMYLLMPSAVHRDKALALLAAGKSAEAEKELDAALKIFAQDDELPISVVGFYDAAGRKAEADRFYERFMTPHRRLVEQYPQSAMFHNMMAWVPVRCHRELDEALAHAIKGVELSPRSTAIIDTLAECYFQKGEKDKAIAAIRRCMEIEPHNGRHALCLKRFEQGSRESAPPLAE